MHEPSIPIGHGLKLVASAHMSDIVEDWSQVRSPGRAKRRRKAKGAAYNEKAAQRSFEHMKLFLNEVLKQ